jgi:hypothetical protein
MRSPDERLAFEAQKLILSYAIGQPAKIQVSFNPGETLEDVMRQIAAESAEREKAEATTVDVLPPT